MLGVDTTTVNNWERNRSNPRLYLIPKIAEFLSYNPFPIIQTSLLLKRSRSAA